MGITTINLGCGNRIIEGAINHDLSYHRDEVNMTFDLNYIPYPLSDNRFDKVFMLSVIEHLIPSPLETLNEIWRITKPNGLLVIKFPLPTSPTFYDDLTHRWANSIKAYEVVDPNTGMGQKYNFYTDRKWNIIDKKQNKNLSAWLTFRKVIS